MIEAQVDVARRVEGGDGVAEDVELLGGAGHRVDVHRRLVALHPRDVRVVEERDALGPDVQHALDGVREARAGLVRQAVDQVHVDRSHALLARPVDDAARQLLGLDALDGLLDLGVEVLDAHRDPVEAEVREDADLLVGRDAWVDLDGDLRAVRQVEARRDRAEETLELGGREARGRPAAPVELLDLAPADPRLLEPRELRLDGAEVALTPLVRPRDLHVAAAEQAQLRAVGDVGVEGERLVRTRVRSGREARGVVAGIEGLLRVLLPVDGRRIGRVPRRGRGVALEELLGHLESTRTRVRLRLASTQASAPVSTVSQRA